MIKILLSLALFLLTGNSTNAKIEKTKLLEVSLGTPKVKRSYSDFDIVVLAVKSKEGLRLNSYKDVNHWSIGWGTSSTEGKTLSLEQADLEMLEAYTSKLCWVKKEFPNLDNWSQLVLSMTKYNIRSFGDILRRAIAKGDKERIAEAIQLYVKDSNGKKLRGLVRRRKLEAKLLLSEPHERDKIAKQLHAVVNKHINKAKKSLKKY